MTDDVLKSFAAEYDTALRPIMRLSEMLRKKDIDSADPKLLDALTAAAGVVEALSPLASRIGEVRQHLEEARDRRFLELEADLRDLAARNGWRLDGHWPTLFVELAIEIKVEAAKKVVTVAGRKMRASSVADIEAEIKSLVRTLLPPDFSGPCMIERVRAAYRSAAGSGQVPILELYRHFVLTEQTRDFWLDATADRFRPVTLDQFRARFSRMLEQGATTSADGMALRLLPPLNPKDGLFVYQPAEARFGYVGRVEFVATDKGETA